MGFRGSRVQIPASRPNSSPSQRLLGRQRGDEPRGEIDPGIQALASRLLGPHPHETSHRLADPEHEAAHLHAAQHVAVKHPAVAPEHLPFADAGARAQGAPHRLRKVRIMWHGPSRFPAGAPRRSNKFNTAPAAGWLYTDGCSPAGTLLAVPFSDAVRHTVRGSPANAKVAAVLVQIGRAH